MENNREVKERMASWDTWDELEKPKCEISDGVAKINGTEIRDGDIVTFINRNLIVRQGRIRFGIYQDYGDSNRCWHLGFYVEWPDYDADTLVDALAWAEKKGWEWRIERGEERE